MSTFFLFFSLSLRDSPITLGFSSLLSFKIGLLSKNFPGPEVSKMLFLVLL